MALLKRGERPRFTHPTYTFFKLSEFDSPDEPGSGAKMQPDFLRLLERARNLASIPFVIISGFRTERRNKLVGGASNSAHLTGWAADIKFKNQIQFEKMVLALVSLGFNRFGVNRSTLHVDCDPTKRAGAVWNYNSSPAEKERCEWIKTVMAGAKAVAAITTHYQPTLFKPDKQQ